VAFTVPAPPSRSTEDASKSPTSGCAKSLLPLVERPSKLEHPHQPVVGETLLADELRHTALAPSPPDLHLPQPVLGHHEALGEKEVLFIRRVEVRNPPSVAEHLDLVRESLDDDLPFDLRKCLPRAVAEPAPGPPAAHRESERERKPGTHGVNLPRV